MDRERKIVQEDGVSPKLVRRKRRQRVWIAVAVVMAFGGIYLVLELGSAREEYSLSDYTSAEVIRGTITITTEAAGTVVLPKQVELVSTQEGYSRELLIEEGDSVGTDTVLAILDAPTLEDKEADLEGELLSARISMEEVVIQYRYSIEALESDIERREEAVRELKAEVEELKELSDLRSSRESDYEAAVDKLEAEEDALEDTRKELDRQGELREVSIARQEAQIGQLATSLQRVREDIQEMEIQSPIPGEVLSINEDLAVPGSLISQKTTLFKIADPEETYIDLEVYEEYAGLLSPGGRMTVTVGGDTFEAEIVRVGKIAVLSSDGLATTVSVRARPVESVALTLGASAVAVIPLGTRENTLILPRGAYLTTGSREFIYRIEGGRAVKLAISLGEIQANQVEVLAGVEEGDEVIISSYRDYIDQNAVVLE